MARKRTTEERPRQCITCGKTLPAGVHWCASCGTHDEVDLDSRVADLSRQIERSGQRNYWHMLLTRLTFGLWRY